MGIVRDHMVAKDLTCSPNLRGKVLKEKMYYSFFAFIFPSTKLLELHDPQVLAMRKKVVPDRPETSDDLTKHVWVHWNVNTTLFDAEHHGATSRDKLYLNLDPFDSMDHFPFPTEPKESEILTNLHPSSLQ